jgi:hypothetical protein
MNITLVYAIVIASIALCLLIRNFCSRLAPLLTHISMKMSKHLKYNYVLKRHAVVGPWSVASALVQAIYLTACIFCLTFGVADLSQAGRRAGTLSLINLGPPFASLHLDFLANLLGLSLGTFQKVHRLFGLAAFVLAAFHVLVAAAKEKQGFRTESLHSFVIIVG